MKLPRYSLRTMLIVVAIIAAVVGWLRYESQRGWTVAKAEKLIADEFDSTWDIRLFEGWATKHDFQAVFKVDPNEPRVFAGPKNPKVSEILQVSFPDPNFGIGNYGWIGVYIYFDQDGQYVSHWLATERYTHAPTRMPRGREWRREVQ